MTTPAWWAGSESISERLLCPYSISTGIEAGGDAEIAGLVDSIRTNGVN